MKLVYKVLKDRLKVVYANYISLYQHDPDFKPRCYRIIDMFCLIKYSTLNKKSQDDVYELYNNVCKLLEEKRNIELLSEILRKLEKDIIFNFISTLGLLEDEAFEIYKKAED